MFGRLHAFSALMVVALGPAGLGAVAEPAQSTESAVAIAEADNSAGRRDAVTAMAAAQASGQPVEDLSQRDEFSRVFANADGTWSAEMSNEPVRVQHHDGQWHEIDTNLVRHGDGWAPAVTSAEVVFSDGGDRTIAALTASDRDLSWRWPATLPEPEVEGATLTYPAVAPGEGDLVVTATPTGFSYDVVLHEVPSEPVEFPVPVLTDGAELRETAHGALEIRTPSGDVLAAAPRPMMWDSSGADPGGGVDSGLGETDNVAPVDAGVQQPESGAARLVLAPDQDFLEDPDTVYPVTVDPSWTVRTSGDAWVQNAGYTTGQTGSPELRAGTYDGGSHKARSFIHFDGGTSKWANKPKIVDADLVLRNFHSNNCNSARIRVRPITQSWNGYHLTWGNQPNVGSRYADYAPAKGAGSNCAAGNATWNVTDIVQDWADGTLANHGVRLGAVDETNNASWRKYRSANYSTATERPTLHITYNHYPGTATAVSAIEGSEGLVRTLTPTLSARVTDRDGGSLRANFEVRQGSDLLWSGTTPAPGAASGGVASMQVPAGTLLDGAHYTLRAKGFDGSLHSQQWSTTYAFTVDTGAPPPDVHPTVQQVIDLMGGEVSEADVLADIDYIIVGSGEDGSTPLTFDEAAEALLTAVQESLEEAPQEEPQEPQESCLWIVQADDAAVVVAREGNAEVLTPEPEGDPETPVYTGQVDGEPITVTVFQGAPEAEIAQTLTDAESDIEELSDASVDGAVDGEQEAEVEQEFTNPAQPDDFETVAYRLEEGADAVEYGVPEPDVPQGSAAMTAADAADDCVRSDPTEPGATLDTEEGQITLPSGAEESSNTGVGTMAAAATYPDTSSAVRYRTFIANPLAPTGKSGWLCGQFRGDDRGFSSYYDRPNRTRSSVFFNWPSRTIDTTKRVGATHRIAAYGRSAKTKTASSAGIKFHHASMSRSYGRISVLHSVGNPLCRFAGDIFYNVVIEVWKKGGARISGDRSTVPWHEAYLYPKTESWGRTIMRLDSKHFMCLSAPFCSRTSVWKYYSGW